MQSGTLSEEEDGYQHVNILVTVDSTTSTTSTYNQNRQTGRKKRAYSNVSDEDKQTNGSDIGGWFPQGLLLKDMTFSILSLASMVTAIREGQALMSIKVHFLFCLTYFLVSQQYANSTNIQTYSLSLCTPLLYVYPPIQCHSESLSPVSS